MFAHYDYILWAFSGNGFGNKCFQNKEIYNSSKCNETVHVVHVWHGFQFVASYLFMWTMNLLLMSNFVKNSLKITRSIWRMFTVDENLELLYSINWTIYKSNTHFDRTHTSINLNIYDFFFQIDFIVISFKQYQIIIIVSEWI